MSTLILKGKVLFDHATGEVIITDTATASRIGASTLNFAVDSEKLKKVVAESVLISVAYKFSKLVTHPKPELGITHSYFELHSKTSANDLRNNLDVFESLGLIKANDTKSLMGGGKKFGRTTLFVETVYEDSVVNTLFLNNGSARSQREYEAAGRKALAMLVQSDEDEAIRRKPAVDDALWERDVETGPGKFQVHGGVQKSKRR